MSQKSTKYELSEEDCAKPVTDKDLVEISTSCGFPYERLSPYLRVERVVAQAIKRDWKSEPERRAALLEWSQTMGSDATYKALIAGLLEIKRKKDAEVICNLLKNSKSATSSSIPMLHVPSEPSEVSSGIVGYS